MASVMCARTGQCPNEVSPTTRFIGGSTMGHMNDPSRRGSRVLPARVRNSFTASEEEIMVKYGITKATKVEAMFGDRRWMDKEVNGALKNAASRFHVDESMKTFMDSSSPWAKYEKGF